MNSDDWVYLFFESGKARQMIVDCKADAISLRELQPYLNFDTTLLESLCDLLQDTLYRNL